MKQDKPSYTAEVVACYRAVESLKPENQRVCYDPLAVYFLRTSFRLLCGLGPLVQPLFWLLAERQFSDDVAQGIGRTRYIDDYVKHCIDNGIKQMVILGAGFDSRAYRIEGLREVKVFEVDHPTTQSDKKAKLAKQLVTLSADVTYVSIDFEQETLEEKIMATDYDKTLKTLFIWEGVTYFLSAEAVDVTLTFVRKMSGYGSSIIFDYIFKSVIDGKYQSVQAKREQEILANIGEPYTFGIDQGTIEEFLLNRGFCDVIEVSHEHLTSSYFEAANQNRQYPPYLPLVYATVNSQA